jgi:uncharacterized protein YigE (DUF2233 family)
MDSMLQNTGALLFMAFLIAALAAAQAAIAGPAPCAPLTHEGNAYTVCEADLRRHSIHLFWKQPDGSPFGHLKALPRTLGQPAQRLIFATNAGMFDPAFKPVGLYIEEGRTLVRANTKSGAGNFHLKPNGVFYVAGNKAGVLETGAYLKQQLHPDMATQSGPMLVIQGRVHPLFIRANISLKPRIGVGVRDGHTVVFALSEGGVSFAAFARLFRDNLNCSNALFLDGGSVPSLYVPSVRPGNVFALGPMIAVFDKPSGVEAPGR